MGKVCWCMHGGGVGMVYGCMNGCVRYVGVCMGAVWGSVVYVYVCMGGMWAWGTYGICL